MQFFSRICIMSMSSYISAFLNWASMVRDATKPTTASPVTETKIRTRMSWVCRLGLAPVCDLYRSCCVFAEGKLFIDSVTLSDPKRLYERTFIGKWKEENIESADLLCGTIVVYWNCRIILKYSCFWKELLRGRYRALSVFLRGLS